MIEDFKKPLWASADELRAHGRGRVRAHRARATVAIYYESRLAKAYSVLEEKLDVLRSLLHGFDYRDFLTECHELLAGAVNGPKRPLTAPNSYSFLAAFGNKETTIAPPV